MVNFSKDEVIYSQQQPVDEIIFIRDGFAKATSLHDDGTQRTIWIAGRYDVTPIDGLYKPGTSAGYDYIAMTPGSGYRINKKHFLTTIADSIEAHTEITHFLSDHSDMLLQHIHAMNQSSVRMRLLHALHGIATRFSSVSSCDLYDIGLPLTHQDIADLIGSTRETASLELKRIMKEGLIQYSRSTFLVHTDTIASHLQTPAS